VTIARDRHSQKQFTSIRATEQGIEGDKSDKQSENASSPIHESSESELNVTTDSDRHPEKQQAPRVLREEGLQIDESDEQFESADRPIFRS
jgi:hypothetical protein